MSEVPENTEVRTPKHSPALSHAESPGKPLLFDSELGRPLAAQIYNKRRAIENDHKYKLQSFALDLDHVGYQLVKKTCATTKSVLKYTKHEDTIRKAIKQLAAKEAYYTTSEQHLSNCEKLVCEFSCNFYVLCSKKKKKQQLDIHANIKIASAETIPIRLCVISQAIHSVVEKQKTITNMSKNLEASIAKAQQLVLPVPR